jgi:hypothetical protein
MDPVVTSRARRWRLSDPFGVRAVTSNRASLTLLLMLLGVLLYYIVRHVRALGDEEESLHFLDTPLGYPEAFQTLQWLWCLGLLGLLAFVLRRWAFAALLPLLAFLLLTDTFELHERLGRHLADALALEPMLGLRPRDLGELMVIGAAALVTVPLALVGLWLARGVDRLHVLRIFLLLGFVLFCGVALDLVHILIIADARPGDAFGLIEDGGEMVGATFLVAYLFWVWMTSRRPDATSPATAAAEVPSSVG